MIHLAETRGEVEAMTRDKGVTPTTYLAELGVLSERTIAAHCVHVGEADLELLAEFNVAVASNPVANLKLGSGVAPVPQMLARGIRVGFGTDGAASNNTLDLLRDVQLAALLYKGITGDPTCMPARTVVELLTIGGATALGLGGLDRHARARQAGRRRLPVGRRPPRGAGPRPVGPRRLRRPGRRRPSRRRRRPGRGPGPRGPHRRRGARARRRARARRPTAFRVLRPPRAGIRDRSGLLVSTTGA